MVKCYILYYCNYMQLIKFCDCKTAHVQSWKDATKQLRVQIIAPECTSQGVILSLRYSVYTSLIKYLWNYHHTYVLKMHIYPYLVNKITVKHIICAHLCIILNAWEPDGLDSTPTYSVIFTSDSMWVARFVTLHTRIQYIWAGVPTPVVLWLAQSLFKTIFRMVILTKYNSNII